MASRAAVAAATTPAAALVFILAIVSALAAVPAMVDAQSAPTQCSGSVVINTGTSGVIRNPDPLTGPYSINTDCGWRFAFPDSGLVVRIHFTYFETENSYDFVTVYNGLTIASPELFRGSGYFDPFDVVTTGGEAFVRFTSDFSVVYSGFEFEWSLVGSQCNDEATVEIASGDSGVIRNPDPLVGTYLNQAWCLWLFNHPLDIRKQYAFSFSFLDTEYDADGLIFYDGNTTGAPVVAIVHGDLETSPTTTVVASGPVLVEFVSDGINTFRGFEMQWERRGAVDVVCSSETLRLSDGLSVTWSALDDHVGDRVVLVEAGADLSDPSAWVTAFEAPPSINGSTVVLVTGGSFSPASNNTFPVNTTADLTVADFRLGVEYQVAYIVAGTSSAAASCTFQVDPERSVTAPPMLRPGQRLVVDWEATLDRAPSDYIGLFDNEDPVSPTNRPISSFLVPATGSSNSEVFVSGFNLTTGPAAPTPGLMINNSLIAGKDLDGCHVYTVRYIFEFLGEEVAAASSRFAVSNEGDVYMTDLTPDAFTVALDDAFAIADERVANASAAANATYPFVSKVVVSVPAGTVSGCLPGGWVVDRADVVVLGCGADLTVFDCKSESTWVSVNGNVTRAPGTAVAVGTFVIDPNLHGPVFAGLAVVNAASAVDTAGGAVLVTDASPMFYRFAVSSAAAALSGGAMHVTGSESVVLMAESVLANNAADGDGGGVYIDDGILLLSDSVLVGNSAGGDGGGIGSDDGIVVTIGTVEIVGNAAAGSGGGIHLEYNPGAMPVTTLNPGTLLLANSAASLGGGINARGELVVRGVTVVENVASSGGGGMRTSDRVTIIDSSFTNNTAGVDGGGLLLTFDDVYIESCEIANNTAGDDGGGLFFDALASQPMFMVDTNVTGNRCGDKGGGVRVDSAPALFDGVIVADNVAGNDGGGLHFGVDSVFEDPVEMYLNDVAVVGNTAGSKGGGLRTMDETTTRLANGTVVASNSATNGGGLYLSADAFATQGVRFEGNTAGDSGGGVYVSVFGNLDLAGVSVSANHGAFGGGLWVTTLGDAFLADSSLVSNTATESGGGAGIYAFGLLLATDTLFESNTAARNGGGVYGTGASISLTDSEVLNNVGNKGGGLGVTDTDLVVTTCTVAGNTVVGSGSEAGGGIYAEISPLNAGDIDPGSVSVIESEIDDNSGAVGGGVTAVGESMVVLLTDVNMTRNSAFQGGALHATDSAVIDAISCLVASNAATQGGGVFADAAGSVFLHQTTLSDNEGFEDGGGAFLDRDGILGLQHSVVDANYAKRGGGLFVGEDMSVNLTLANATISGNSAAVGAGAAFFSGSVTLLASVLTGNTASIYGGGLASTAPLLMLEQSRVGGNTATLGAGLYVGCDPWLAVVGRCTNKRVRILDCELVGNVATDAGGALYATSHVVEIMGGSLVNNSAAGNGGGVALFRAPTPSSIARDLEPAADSVSLLFNVTLSGNAAVDGGGGGVWSSESAFAVEGSVLAGNSAGTDGGGVSTDIYGTVANSTLVNNTAGSLGGGIYFCTYTCAGVAAASVDLSATSTNTFVGNAAVGGVNATSDAFRVNVVTAPRDWIPSGGSVAADEAPIQLSIQDYFFEPITSVVRNVFKVEADAADAAVVRLFGALTAVPQDGVVSFDDVRLEVRSLGDLGLHSLRVADSVIAALGVDFVVDVQYCEPGQEDVGSAGVSVSCADCGVGTYNDGSFLTCQPCAEGHFANQTKLDACLPCGRGTFQANPGRSACDDCGAGTFAAETGADECEPCHRGTVQREEGQSACVPCEPGRFIGLTGQTECTFCSAGTFANDTGTEVCAPCEAGRFQPLPGSSNCTVCAEGSFNADVGRTACIWCSKNTYTFDPTVPCKTCDVTEASCEQGDLEALPGFYQFSEETFQACPPGYCAGAGLCNDNRAGVLCGACAEGFTLDKGDCVQCDSFNWLIMSTMVIGLVVFCVYLIFFTKVDNARLKIVTFFAQTLALLLQDDVRSEPVAPEEITSSWSLSNLDFNFVPNTCLAPMDYYQRFVFAVASPLALFVVMAAVYAVELCVNHYQHDGDADVLAAANLKTLNTSHVGKNSGHGLAAFGVDSESDLSEQDIEDRIRVLMSSRVNYYKHNAARSRMGIRYRQALAGAALFIYTPLMKAILGVLNCQPEYDPADGEEVPVYRIADDLSVICRQDGVFTSPYATYRSVSIFLLIIYVYAFPLFIGIFLLYLKWKNLLTDIRTVEYWGVLYYPYDSEYFWFEAVMQLRKTAVVTIVVFSPDGDVRRLLLFALFASLLFIQAMILPYRQRSDDHIECFLLLLLTGISVVLSSTWIQRTSLSKVDIYMAILPPSTLPWALLLGFVIFFLFRVYRKRQEANRFQEPEYSTEESIGGTHYVSDKRHKGETRAERLARELQEFAK